MPLVWLQGEAVVGKAQDVINALLAYRDDGLCPKCGRWVNEVFTTVRVVYCPFTEACGWRQIVEA